MKKILLVICIIFVVAVAFMITIYSYPESFGLTKPHTTIREPDGKLISPISFYEGTNCNESGLVNATCFVDSFESCSPAKITSIYVTPEGDPIREYAIINSDCSIEVYHDSTLDRFGKQTIANYFCNEAKINQEELRLDDCVDENESDEYGFIFDDIFGPEVLEQVLESCECQDDPERTCEHTLIEWLNFTHRIDNNLCEFNSLE